MAFRSSCRQTLSTFKVALTVVACVVPHLFDKKIDLVMQMCVSVSVCVSYTTAPQKTVLNLRVSWRFMFIEGQDACF